MHYARNPEVVIRREHFGGIAFNKANGTLIELDREACIFFEQLDGETSLQNIGKQIQDELNVNVSIPRLYDVAESLIGNGFICKGVKSYHIIAEDFPEQKDYLSAPESVHLAVTHRCNYHCTSCYVDDSVTEEMTTTEIKNLIDEMADMKVFQLAIGGGEPFLRDDLVDIVRYARLKGIVPNITTNGSLLTSEIAEQLSGHIGQIQISVNGHNRSLHESFRQTESFDNALIVMKILREQKIKFGINVLLSKDNLREIEQIISFAAKQGASTINFLRPKPSKSESNWYERARLSENDYKTVQESLKNVLGNYHIKITIDCALSFLMNSESPDDLQKHGVYGCSGARRFLSIHPDGNTYPCSFIDSYYGGNIKNGLKGVWEGFNEFRELQVTGKCGVCNISKFCAGCKAILLYETNDILSQKQGCFIKKST